MNKQIGKDLKPFQRKKISHQKLDSLFKEQGAYLHLAKFSIKDNQIFVELALDTRACSSRAKYYKNALAFLAKEVGLPDCVFLLTMHDEIYIELDLPVFAMAKEKDKNFILVPDFEALKENYQVLKGKDITQEEFPWEQKISKLVWRGSTVQRSIEGVSYIDRDNMHSFSRVIACQLAHDFPHLMDAGFTSFKLEDPPCLKTFSGKYMSFERQTAYKYHILLDGNSCPYSNSGWKFFLNSVVFKPDSPHIQWYYNELKEWVHYIPVHADLHDLVEKLSWATSHDELAADIAGQTQEFANTHLTLQSNLTYLYHVVCQYSKLEFMD